MAEGTVSLFVDRIIASVSRLTDDFEIILFQKRCNRLRGIEVEVPWQVKTEPFLHAYPGFDAVYVGN